MTLIDPALPRLMPEGHYTFEIAAEPEKKSNQWGGSYWRFQFFVKDSSGVHFDFSDIFTQKDDRYHELLIVLGGKEDDMGVVHLPDLTFTGRKFEADIKHFPSKNDQDKTYCRVVNIRPLEEQTPAEERSSPDGRDADNNPF